MKEKNCNAFNLFGKKNSRKKKKGKNYNSVNQFGKKIPKRKEIIMLLTYLEKNNL